MSYVAFLRFYLLWHYSRSWGDVFVVWSNFVWFLYHFFSIPLLLRTLFAPWKRIQEEPEHVLDIQDFFATVVVNVLMRAVGAVVRICVIGVGVLMIILATIAGACVFVLWAALPLLVPILLIAGFFGMISMI